jgi:hypothetical protein
MLRDESHLLRLKARALRASPSIYESGTDDHAVTVIIIPDTSGSEYMLGLTLVDQCSFRYQCVSPTDVDD